MTARNKSVAPQGMCSKCKKPCIAATTGYNPPASEWYCMPCAISHPMPRSEYEPILKREMEAQAQARQQPGR